MLKDLIESTLSVLLAVAIIAATTYYYAQSLSSLVMSAFDLTRLHS